MVDKKFIGLDKPDITRFESYLPTAFSSELTLLQKVNKIIQDLNRSFDLTNEMVDYLNRFIESFDEKLYETLEDVLTVWLEDGRLADIVRVAISEEVIEARTDYLGKKYVDLKERLDGERKEVILARGGAQTLGERLNESDAQLAQSAKKLDTKTVYLISTGGDDTLIAQDAFNQLQDGDCLYVKGEIRFTNDLFINNLKNVTLKGDGSRVSYFYNDSLGKTITFTGCSYWTITGVGFLGNGNTFLYGEGATGGDGLRFLNSIHFNFTDCEISYHGGNGIDLIDGCWVFNFVNQRIIGNQLNGFYATIKTSLQATAINFTNPLIFANKKSGILWASTALSVTGGVIENNDIGINFDCSQTNAGATGIVISGVDFELNKNGHIKGKSTATHTLANLEIGGCHFTDDGTALKPFIWFEGVLNLQSVRIGKNAYTGFSAVNIIDFNNLSLATCDIEIIRGLETKFVNLGQAIVKGFAKKIALNGLLDQKGIPFSQLDKSDNLFDLPVQIGYWKLPNSIVRLNSLDIYIDSNATTDYSVQFSIYRLSENGTMTPSFSTTATKTGGGNGKLSFSGIGLTIPFTTNETLYVKTTINKPSTGTTLYVKNLTFYGEF